VAHAAGSNSVGIILTGMGRDGAHGMLDMRKAGASTVGQDEGSCVVYGMPKAARENGAVEIELPLNKIAAHVLKQCEALAGRGVRV
jgi:two-component system chemotaxis response regulator CheB